MVKLHGVVIGKTTWRCCNSKCKASCFTYGQSLGSKYPVDMKDMKEHNHTPDLQKEHILEKRRKIKTPASLCDEAPRKIISKCVDDTLETETVVSMPSYSADVQAINRANAKVRPVYPPKPSKLSDIELPEFLKHGISRKRAEDGTEMDGETFLLHDSGVEDEDRFFMFGTEANIKNFEIAELYADGTFSIASDLFLQVYTIHCVIHGRCLPMVYCLLPRKTGAIYEKLLRVIEKKMTRPPKSFTSDFELALIKAVRTVWPEVTIYLCFFHFKQIMWRKIQDLGLAGIYKSDESVRKLLKLLQILAFVPVADVQDLFHHIKSQLQGSTTSYKDQIVEFYEYFEGY